jgi:hypothetical protein
MNSRHVYIGNYYSFSTPSSKYKASNVGGFFDIFHEIFSKYREENQYRVTDASALRHGRIIFIYAIEVKQKWVKVVVSLHSSNWIKILLNYLFEFERIRTGDCEKPLIKPTS